MLKNKAHLSQSKGIFSTWGFIKEDKFEVYYETINTNEDLTILEKNNQNLCVQN